MNQSKLKEQLLLKDTDPDKSLIQKLLESNIYRTAIGAVFGGIAGFLYWKFIGCNSGSCPITSNPVQSVLLFGVMGGFLVKDQKKKKEEKN